LDCAIGQLNPLDALFFLLPLNHPMPPLGLDGSASAPRVDPAASEEVLELFP
jgi:hypothetical protein